MRKISATLFAVFFVLSLSSSAYAFFIDFEDGTEGAAANDIVGVSFQDFFGFDALYGDSSTGAYNTTSDDLGYGYGAYHHNGNFFLWAGPNADAQGTIVDFTNNDGTWFKTGYSSSGAFYLDAFLTDGTMASVNGTGNIGSPMDFLSINATIGTYIDYVVLHDTGNHWLVDDISGDASGVGVPEPATLFLLGIGLFGLAGFGRKKRIK